MAGMKHPDFDNFIARFNVRRVSNNEYSCICPAHDDRQASLCIHCAEDGKILVHCQAGCDTSAVLNAVGLKMSDLFPGDSNSTNTHGESNSKDTRRNRTVATYPYVDADGHLLYEVVRQHPKRFIQRRPDPDRPGKYIWNTQGITRVPYQLPLIQKAIADNVTIFIVEGEKDVHTLHNIKCAATCNPGGAGKWLDSYSQYFKGANIILLPDNDTPGCEHMMQVACSLSKVAESVCYVQLPELPHKGDVSDWFTDSAHTPEQFLELAANATAWVPGTIIQPTCTTKSDTNTNDDSDNPDASNLPTIVVSNRQQRDITTDVIRSLEANNHTKSLFIRLGRLVRLRTQVSSKIQTPIIDEVTPDIVRHLLSLSANYVRLTPKGDEINCLPPIDTARDIIARGLWEFPQLDAITESPVMRPDGTILSEPGYDEATHLFYAPDTSLALPSIPNAPTASDLAAARDCIEDILWDFPFTEPADRANLIAMMLTQVIRPAIDGRVPIGIIDAPQPGSGKGLLTQLINMIAVGKPLAAVTAPTTPEEWPKQITSLLAMGTTMIVFDNLETILNNPDLAALVTMPEWKGRILGQSKMLSIPNCATILVTGNNVQTGGDIARRCYWTTINPNTSTPELRTGFRHKNLLKHIATHRGEILAALLTMARAWYVAGQPDPSTPILGSFDEWARILGGILQYSGIEGFLGNAETHRSDSDAESGANERFLQAIYTTWNSRSFTTKELNNEISLNDALNDACPDFLLAIRAKSEASFVRSCGKLFSRIAGRRYGAENIAISKSLTAHSHRISWFVKCDEIKNIPQENIYWISEN